MELKELLQYALVHAPGLAQTQEQLRIKGWQRDQAEAKFLPSLDLVTSQGLQKSVAPPWADHRDALLGTAPPTTSPLFGQLGLSLTETFYDNGQAQTQWEISRTDREVAAVVATQTRDQVILAATKAYYAVCQAAILLDTSREQYQLLDKQLRQLDAMYHQGLKTQREFLRLQSAVRRAAVDVKSSETNVRTAEVDLRRAIGASQTAVDLSFGRMKAEALLSQKLPFPAAVPSAAQSYEARIGKLEDDSAAKRIELARRKNLPQLTLSSGAGYNNPDYLGFQGRPQAQDTFTWNITVGLTYNIWDSGTRRHDIDIAASQQQLLTEDTRDKLDGLDADIARLMASLANLKDNWQVNLQLISLEQQNLTNVEQDYREGKVGYLDLVTSLNAVLTAKVTFYSTYFSTLQALAQYHYHEGTIFDYAMAGA